MAIVSVPDLISHAKADGDDNDVLQKCIDAAESECQTYCGRRFYLTENALTEARANVNENTKAVYTEYYDAQTDAEDQWDGTQAARDYVRQLLANARKRRDRKLAEIASIDDGIVVTKGIYNAILITAAFFYRNRDNNVGLPQSAKDLLDRHVVIPEQLP